MGEPVRIQRKRIKGWRMPPHARSVGRESKWGNPFVVGASYHAPAHGPEPWPIPRIRDATDAVAMFRWWIARPQQAALVEDARIELRGRSLACWCSLGQPCHADVWLELANPPGGDR